MPARSSARPRGPALPRHIKMRHDAGRGALDPAGARARARARRHRRAVLKLCNGERSVGDIAAVLSHEYQAPLDVIKSDVVRMLQDLADKGVVKA